MSGSEAGGAPPNGERKVSERASLIVVGMRHNTRTQILRTLAPLATAAVLLSACGDDGADAASGTVEVTATDYAFIGVPERVESGTTLTMRNTSEAEAHEVVAIRLPDGETRSVSDLVALPPDELAAFFPGVATVLVAGPGAEAVAVEGDGTLTEPGRYALICVIPTGADPEEYLAAAAAAEGGPPDVAGGPPHIVKGMFGEIEVVDT